MFKMKVEKNCSSCVLCPNLIVLCGTFVLDLLPCFVTFSTNVSSRVSSVLYFVCDICVSHKLHKCASGLGQILKKLQRRIQMKSLLFSTCVALFSARLCSIIKNI